MTVPHLLTRIESAEKADPALERDIKLAIAAHMFAAGASKDDVVQTVGGNLYNNPPPWTASGDAALALVERMLPGAEIRTERKPRYCYAVIVTGSYADGLQRTHHGERPDSNLASAIIAALLKALITKDPAHEQH